MKSLFDSPEVQEKIASNVDRVEAEKTKVIVLKRELKDVKLKSYTSMGQMMKLQRDVRKLQKKIYFLKNKDKITRLSSQRSAKLDIYKTYTSAHSRKCHWVNVEFVGKRPKKSLLRSVQRIHKKREEALEKEIKLIRARIDKLTTDNKVRFITA